MQEGIRHVREGRMGEAYKVFKKVIERNPRNEFAWIWVSVTSEDRVEKRAALEKALEINPNSTHAKEALRALNAEESRLASPAKPDPTSQPTAPMQVVTPPPVIENPATPAPAPTPAPPTLPVEQTNNPFVAGKGETSSNPANLGRGESSSNPVRIGNLRTSSRPGRVNPQEIVSNPFYEMPPELADRVAADKANAATRPYRVGHAENLSNPNRAGTRPPDTAPQVGNVDTPVNLVNSSAAATAKKETVAKEDKAANTREKRERLFFRRIRLTALFILAILVVLLAAFFVFNFLQKQANQTQPTATQAATQSGPTAETPSAGASGTAQPTITVPPLTTASGTAVTATPGGATTTQAGPNPTQAAITKNLQAATSSQASGDYQGAITAYQAVIQADTTNVPANLGLGMLYLTAPDSALPSGTDRYAGAVKAFQVVTAQNPNWAGGYSHLGEALALQGNVKEAITAYSRSLELDPNGPERWLALAALYEKDNQPDQARYCRERAGSLAATTAAPTATATPAPTTPAPSTTTQ
jgi:tetratricopeptide (TPR) repeat protein